MDVRYLEIFFRSGLKLFKFISYISLCPASFFMPVRRRKDNKYEGLNDLTYRSLQE